jgi:hypothetical protein
LISDRRLAAAESSMTPEELVVQLVREVQEFPSLDGCGPSPLARRQRRVKAFELFGERPRAARIMEQRLRPDSVAP